MDGGGGEGGGFKKSVNEARLKSLKIKCPQSTQKPLKVMKRFDPDHSPHLVCKALTKYQMCELCGSHIRQCM